MSRGFSAPDGNLLNPTVTIVQLVLKGPVIEDDEYVLEQTTNFAVRPSIVFCEPGSSSTVECHGCTSNRNGLAVWTSSAHTAQLSETHTSTLDREKPAVAREEERTAVNDRAEKKESSDRVYKAAAVLQDLTSAADKRIPNELLERAEAIAVIPNMIKGAFSVGGRYGKGVVAQRLNNGRWSALPS
jgi:hypothetical protein